jgi:hypothetical protein
MQALYTATATAVGGSNGSIRSSDDVLDLKLAYPRNWAGQAATRQTRSNCSRPVTQPASRTHFCGLHESARHRFGSQVSRLTWRSAETIKVSSNWQSSLKSLCRTATRWKSKKWQG